MKTHEFTIIAAGMDPEAPDFADRFYEAGCNDATIAFQKGVIILDFDREARSFSHALASAITAVQRAGARVARIEPDHLVSLSDIAKRSGMTRAAISLYANGERSRDFPNPVARVMTDSPLWDWVEVSRWLYRQNRVDIATVFMARLVKEINVAIAQTMDGHLARKLDLRYRKSVTAA